MQTNISYPQRFLDFNPFYMSSFTIKNKCFNLNLLQKKVIFIAVALFIFISTIYIAYSSFRYFKKKVSNKNLIPVKDSLLVTELSFVPITVTSLSPSFSTKWPAYNLDFFKEKETKKTNFMEIIRSIREKGGLINIFEKEGEICAYHTSTELLTWATIESSLQSYFWGGSKNIFRQYMSQKGMFSERLANERQKIEFWESLLDKEKIPLEVQKIDMPNFSHFSGSPSEINQIFDSMLDKHQGVIVGEYSHGHHSPKAVLAKQMPYLFDKGVKNLFLEFCCFDTLQIELDQFFETKKASPFLENFLKNGFGWSVPKIDYFDLVQAAVKAGIRPIGLETSDTHLLGYSSFGGASGKDRMVGMNMCGKEIIARESKGEKFIALVGAAHSSYASQTPGLSEMLQVPSLVIKDDSECSYFPYCENLNLKREDIEKQLNNREDQVFYSHAFITIKRDQ